MLLVKLPVNSRLLLGVKFLGSQVICGFSTVWGRSPKPQLLFKGLSQQCVPLIIRGGKPLPNIQFRNNSRLNS